MVTAVVADTGRWVSDALGVRLRTTSSPVDLELTDLVGLAVRRNPRRAHLLVSRVLAKHVPTDPRVVRASGRLLGDLVRARLAGASLIEGSARGHALRAALAGDDDAAASLVGGGPDDRPADGSDHGELVDGGVPGVAATVLGYAETATALGEQVADALAAPYLHSTRRAVRGLDPVGGFEEEHSHATSHLLLPADPAMLAGAEPLVLVDDELSTGRTALNTIEVLHAASPRAVYVIAALVDLRSADDRAVMADLAARLGATIDVVALAAGEVVLPDGLTDDAAALVARLESVPSQQCTSPADHLPHDPDHGDERSVRTATIEHVALPWPADVPESARHGRLPGGAQRFADAVDAAARAVGGAITSSGGGPATRPERVLVLGTEELMDVPQRIASALWGHLDDAVVRFSSTTRSPVLAVDEDGYAIRSAMRFPAPDVAVVDDAGVGDTGVVPAGDEPARNDAAGNDPAVAGTAVVGAADLTPAATADLTPAAVGAPRPADRFAYNVAGGGFDVVVVVLDEPAAGPAAGGLLDQLARVASRVVVATLPDAAARVARGRATPAALHGPEFGSYARDEVSWLLTDLSDVQLEAPVEEREEAIQAGGAHYAESLPVEYQPSAAYAALFEEALADAAQRVALAVGVVTERALAARPDGLTLVSLARAGTPIGILMRRWAQHVHGVELGHYAVSIVRGRGIDPVALRHVTARHHPGSVLFVDGWTGKGAIARELSAALEEFRAQTGDEIPADLAVLADPGHCVRLYGTRDDFLIPSACLNSTVSGLVSRTVLNRDLLTPQQFHGAKFYADLAPADVSGRFLDAVTACFDDVRAAVAATPAAPDDVPDWRGWRAVERVSTEQGIGDVNLVKPGVGETTRVLLRRVPWKILVRAQADPRDLVHIRHLAAERGVPVEAVPDLPYSCIGLIHPAYTAGATGASGTSAARRADTDDAAAPSDDILERDLRRRDLV